MYCKTAESQKYISPGTMLQRAARRMCSLGRVVVNWPATLNALRINGNVICKIPHLSQKEKIMAYATISTWKANSKIEDEDAMYQVVQEKYVPALKAMGATQAMWVQTGDGEIAIISVYPDEAACNAADAKRAEVRSQGSSEFDATLTGEMRGEVRASG
jgi:hypothetical protein